MKQDKIHLSLAATNSIIGFREGMTADTLIAIWIRNRRLKGETEKVEQFYSNRKEYEEFAKGLVRKSQVRKYPTFKILKKEERVDYGEYLRSKYWQDFSFVTRMRAGKCRVCGEKNRLHVHHKRYTDSMGNSILYKESPGDVIVLCENCHKIAHKYHKNTWADKTNEVWIDNILAVGGTPEQALSVTTKRGYKKVRRRLIKDAKSREEQGPKVQG